LSPPAILVVDDTPANLQATWALLETTGAELVTASSGQEALRQLLARDFAVILLDVQMPDLDGYQAAQLIRARDRSRHTPIIFVTAYTPSQTNVLRGYGLGAVDFLFKPVVPEILTAKVAVFLELHGQREELRRQAELLREGERREYERALSDARQRHQAELLKKEMERERKVAEALDLRARELAQLVREKATAEAALRRNNERLQLLADTADALLREEDPLQVLAVHYRHLGELLGFEVQLQYAFDEKSGALKLVEHHGIRDLVPEGLTQVPPGGGAIGRLFEEPSRITLAIADTPLDEPLRQLGLRHVTCLPMLTPRRLCGSLVFGSRTTQGPDPEGLAVLQLLADQAAVSVERARLVAELREADRRKNEFLAMLGHELRNPLAPVNNALEVLRLRCPPDKLVQRALAASARQVRHMTRLVDDLLDVSRITRGKVELRREKIELTSVVEQALHESEQLLRARGHTLELHLPEAPVVLEADPNRLIQVLANLLLNAAKYTDPGGRVCLRARQDGAWLELRVGDSGVGIAKEMLEGIFDMFVQVDPGADRSQGGLGLGLTLVKTLVELHGGTVSAHSLGVGEGAEFVVRLPLPDQPTQAQALAAPTASMSATAPRRLNILLVEDNEDIRLTMRDLLELQGHQVNEVGDGLAAVERLLADPPHLALVDIGLPGIDGYRVAEQFRAARNTVRTRLVALTGYGSQEARNKALAAGFDAHLVKPISAEELWRVLDDVP
jgi:signal transduction histidine kinase/DNA-binding response OmpR family regulator